MGSTVPSAVLSQPSQASLSWFDGFIHHVAILRALETFSEASSVQRVLALLSPSPRPQGPAPSAH